MKNIDDNNKIEILISALNERYQSMHNIRDRVQNTGIWILGILSSISGWLIQSSVYLTCFNKIIYLIALFATYHVIRFHYLEDLNKGFKGQQKVAAKIEKNLNLFDHKFFSDEDESLYPESWEKAGMENGDGKFFETTYLLINLGFIFLSISILFN